jgi:hypothetical protein
MAQNKLHSEVFLMGVVAAFLALFGMVASALEGRVSIFVSNISEI